MIAKVTSYIRTSREELKKVVWPSQKEVTHHTMFVILLSLATAIFLGGVDYILNLLLQVIFA